MLSIFNPRKPALHSVPFLMNGEKKSYVTLHDMFLFLKEIFAINFLFLFELDANCLANFMLEKSKIMLESEKRYRLPFFKSPFSFLIKKSLIMCICDYKFSSSGRERFMFSKRYERLCPML